MEKQMCKTKGCRAHAWHGGLCNYHALEYYRKSNKKRVPTEDRLAIGKRLLKKRAEELGIVLADETDFTLEVVPAITTSLTGRKLRSPIE